MRRTMRLSALYRRWESECGAKVKKALSTRTHKCKCGCTLDRDENAARNILNVPGFHGAVIINIPEDLRDREFSVFGEYERNALKRIIIEIADSIKGEGEKVWDYNFFL